MEEIKIEVKHKENFEDGIKYDDFYEITVLQHMPRVAKDFYGYRTSFRVPLSCLKQIMDTLKETYDKSTIQ